MKMCLLPHPFSEETSSIQALLCETAGPSSRESRSLIMVCDVMMTFGTPMLQTETRILHNDERTYLTRKKRLAIMPSFFVLKMFTMAMYFSQKDRVAPLLATI